MAFLPISKKDMKKQGIKQLDFVYIIGDAYVDHPSFGHAIISRVLQAHGYTVGIISQPDWKDDNSINILGEPRLGFLIMSGNMDSMVNHYYVSKKRRETDAYTPGGVIGKRPDHAVVVYSFAVKTMGGMSPLKFFKGMLPAIMFAFSSSSSVGTLPINMECVENMGASKEVSSFVLPLGATINMDGTAIYQGVCAIFIASCYGIHLTLPQMLTMILTATLASIGTAGVPGAGMVMLAMVLASVGLPVDGIALVAGVDRIFDMGRTVVNITGDASCCIIVSNMERKKDAKREIANGL